MGDRWETDSLLDAVENFYDWMLQDVSKLLSVACSRAVVSVYFVVMTCALEQWS